jgi:hypothetical protein
MNLEQHTEIILKWVYSCDTSEQLNLLSDVIERFIKERFVSFDKIGVIMAVEELNTAMEFRRNNIIELEKQRESVPTLAYQNK